MHGLLPEEGVACALFFINERCSICDAVFIRLAEGAVRNAWPHKIKWWKEGPADQNAIKGLLIIKGPADH